MKYIIGLIPSLLINFIFNYKNKIKPTIDTISINDEIENAKKEISFYYKVNPIIFNDTILLESYYVLGKDMYYSPIEDEPVTITHNSIDQYVKVKCLRPFDKRIIIKLFSAKNNHVYTKIVLDYKEKFELVKSKLVIDQEKNYFYIEPTINRSGGSVKIDSRVKYNSINYSDSFISEIKEMMKKSAQEKLYSSTGSKDILFTHQFNGFENSIALSLFSPSNNKVFSSFSDQVSYSYFDFSKNKNITGIVTYNVYELLRYDFYYDNKCIFNISYSIDNKTFSGEFRL